MKTSRPPAAIAEQGTESDAEVIEAFLRTVDEAVASGELRVLLWFCPNPHDTQSVVWTRCGEGSVPRCEHCGTVGAAQ